MIRRNQLREVSRYLQCLLTFECLLYVKTIRLRIDAFGSVHSGLTESLKDHEDSIRGIIKELVKYVNSLGIELTEDIMTMICKKNGIDTDHYYQAIQSLANDHKALLDQLKSARIQIIRIEKSISLDISDLLKHMSETHLVMIRSLELYVEAGVVASPRFWPNSFSF